MPSYAYTTSGKCNNLILFFYKQPVAVFHQPSATPSPTYRYYKFPASVLCFVQHLSPTLGCTNCSFIQRRSSSSQEVRTDAMMRMENVFSLGFRVVRAARHEGR